jgi:hypothetical protein
MTHRDPSQPFTLAFVGYTTAASAERAGEYEDAVLPLLTDHGARVVYRGRRASGEDAALPFEVHLLWFPNQAALDAYLADDRRAELLARYGDVFTQKQSVVLETLRE